MTKKDFELIASVIAQFGRVRQNADFLADIMAEKLSEKYPRFNREKFLKACGVEVEYKGSSRENFDELFDYANNS